MKDSVGLETTSWEPGRSCGSRLRATVPDRASVACLGALVLQAVLKPRAASQSSYRSWCPSACYRTVPRVCLHINLPLAVTAMKIAIRRSCWYAFRHGVVSRRHTEVGCLREFEVAQQSMSDVPCQRLDPVWSFASLSRRTIKEHYNRRRNAAVSGPCLQQLRKHCRSESDSGRAGKKRWLIPPSRYSHQARRQVLSYILQTTYTYTWLMP